MPHSFRRGTAVAARRMQPQWSAVLTRSRVAALATTGISIGTVGVASEATTKHTLTRVRGTAKVHLIPNAVSNTMIVAVGLIVVSADAFAVGAAAVPGPITDIDSAWIWHHAFTLGPTQAAAEAGDAIDQYDRVAIDSKAQRKLSPGDTVAFVWEALSLSGTPTADGVVAVRELILLP